MSILRVFKFGGASVKDADAVKNVCSILSRYKHDKLIIVISAMGKTTNALEKVHKARFDSNDTKPFLDEIYHYHLPICSELFGDEASGKAVIEPVWNDLLHKVHTPCTGTFDFEYDQIVGYGELLSTAIVQAYLSEVGMDYALCDARRIIRTDSRYRDARVNWEESHARSNTIREILQTHSGVVIQGFIGSDSENHSTTLGREGSDFTAAIMAFLLDAESVTIWKDVPGMLNADPKWFPNTVKLDRISFHEAIELAYFGASVIHPKTIKPLQNKGIPLYIKSFLDPDAPGSIIQESGEYDGLVPSYIFKDRQVLISITPKDFSFVVEDNLREIFEILSRLAIRISLMENSAISFSVCTDEDKSKQKQLFEELSQKYFVRYNEHLTLMTIRHYDEKTFQMLTSGKEILIEQRSRHTMRLVLRDSLQG